MDVLQQMMCNLKQNIILILISEKGCHSSDVLNVSFIEVGKNEPKYITATRTVIGCSEALTWSHLYTSINDFRDRSSQKAFSQTFTYCTWAQTPLRYVPKNENNVVLDTHLLLLIPFSVLPGLSSELTLPLSFTEYAILLFPCRLSTISLTMLTVFSRLRDSHANVARRISVVFSNLLVSTSEILCGGSCYKSKIVTIVNFLW